MQKQEKNFEQILVVLEIEPEDPHDADIALVDAVRRDTIDALQSDGYQVQFPYTGQRGITPLEVYTAVTDAASYAWAHKDVIEETMNDISTLITLFGGVNPILKHMFRANEQRAIKEQNPPQPIKVTTSIDGAPISVEAPDLEHVEAALLLARRFQSQHPTVATHVTSKSKVKVKGKIPTRQTRRRR